MLWRVEGFGEQGSGTRVHVRFAFAWYLLKLNIGNIAVHRESV